MSNTTLKQLTATDLTGKTAIVTGSKVESGLKQPDLWRAEESASFLPTGVAHGI